MYPELNFRTALNNSFNFGRNRIEAANCMAFGGAFLQTAFSGILVFHVTR